VETPARSSPDSSRTLLLVEDGAAEVQIVQRALRALARDVGLCVVRDGQEALDYLFARGGFTGENNPLPDLVLLDLHMPRVDGLGVLAQIRAHSQTTLLPVVMWTTSCEIDDIRDAYAAGANSYIEKPHDYERLRAVLDTVLRYWLDTALLP